MYKNGNNIDNRFSIILNLNCLHENNLLELKNSVSELYDG